MKFTAITSVALVPLVLSLVPLSCVASDQRDAANKLRAQFYQMQVEDGKQHVKIAAKAKEFNAALEAIRQTCDSKQVDPNTLACLPAQPVVTPEAKAPVAPKPADTPKAQ
jgi:hypothetical protein